MKPVKIFLDELEQDFQGIYKVSDLVAREYFNSKPSKESLLEHFKRKMFNERWNMVEISQKVAALPVDTDPKECLLLSKQAMDEAKHFQLVMEVLEHINGGPIDIYDAQRTHGTKNPSQGASLIDKYEAHNDPMVLAVYQFLAEGRAAVVWQTMADIVEDQFVASRYARIARDEKFHSKIGRMKLEQLCQSAEAQQKVMDLVKDMYWDLYEVSCLSNTAPTQEMKDIMIESYGQPTRELRVAI
jgi:hypothetical protein